MKKIAIIITAILALLGCQKPTPEPIAKEIQISLSYSIDTPKGNDMTKATDKDVYDIFHQHMLTGELVASTYELEFTEINTGAKYSFSGSWKGTDMVTIIPGQYKVEGKSKSEGKYIQSSASLIFDEEIEITSKTTSITLQAKFDCFLIVFAKSNIKTIRLYHTYYGDSSYNIFKTLGEYYYMFGNGKLYENETRKKDACIVGDRDDKTLFKVYVGNANFEKGKYYIYNDLGGAYDLPTMDTALNLPEMEPGI